MTEHLTDPIPMLARWQSHKIVRGGQITMVDLVGRKDGPQNTYFIQVIDKDGDTLGIDIPVEVFARGVPSAGDFIVAYEDGYLSWSPCKVWLAGYTRIAEEPAKESA